MISKVRDKSVLPKVWSGQRAEAVVSWRLRRVKSLTSRRLLLVSFTTTQKSTAKLTLHSNCQARSRGQRTVRCRSATKLPLPRQPNTRLPARLSSNRNTSIRSCTQHHQRIRKAALLRVRICSYVAAKEEEGRFLL